MHVSEMKQRLLDPIREALVHGDLSDAWRRCSLPVRAGISINFTNAGSEFGSWPERKQPPYGVDDGHPLEILSGDLYQAATSDYGKGHVEIVQPESFVIGIDLTAIPYARAQNWGLPKRNLPARTFMALSSDVIVACRDIVAEVAFTNVQYASAA